MMLQDLRPAAIEAHYMSSMNPERAADVCLNSYEELLTRCLAQMPATSHAEFITAYKTRLRGVFSVESRIASFAVTGRAKFNNARNQRANNAYDRRLEEFNAWCDSQVKRGQKAINAAKTDEERDAEDWAKLRREIISSASTIIAIDKKESYYTRSAFVNSIYNRTETFAKHGRTAVIAKALALVEELNKKGPKPVISTRHKFWRLPDFCAKVQAHTAEREGKENKETELDGVAVVRNYTADRLQLIYDDKPDYETRTALKAHAFRWSPSEGAWQRQLTDSAIYAAAQVLGVDAGTL